MVNRSPDESGKRYGRLLVIERSANIGKHAAWRCYCDCGNEIITRGSSLRYGSSTSCGCISSDKLRDMVILPEGMAAKNQVLRRLRANANERGYEFCLTDEQALNIMLGNCFYCGSQPTNVSSHPDFNGIFIYNGLDRVDNTKGYHINNVVTCCKHCNIAKRDRTVVEFLDWICNVYKHSVTSRE